MIHYRSIDRRDRGSRGKKYELLRNYVEIFPKLAGLVDDTIRVEWAALFPNGVISAFAGYKWDGPTGAVDTADFMEGSMVHDILCDLIEDKKLHKKHWPVCADVMRDINKREEMPWIRRQYTWLMVRFWGRVK
jgi:hypothetical protein